MKGTEIQELAESVGALVEKILKLVLRDKEKDDEDKEEQDDSTNVERGAE